VTVQHQATTEANPGAQRTERAEGVRPQIRTVYMGGTEKTARPDALTAREREVLYWLSVGKRYSDIRDLVGISPGTARRHAHSILQKLAVRTVPQAIATALRLGLLR